MSRPRIAFCYRYGLLGGVSAQLLNRYPYLSADYDVSIIYEVDHGMVRRFPLGVAHLTPTPETRAAALREIEPDITVVIDSPNFLDAWRVAGSPGRLVLEVHTTTANLTYLHHLDQLAGVAHIVTVSSYMEGLLGVYGLADLAPVSVVPNVLDDRWSQPSEPESLDGVPVLWVGKLDGHKRWRTAVDLMDNLSQETELPVLPIIVGGLTAPEAEIQALTTKLSTSPGLARGVWWPRVEYDRMPALYSSVGASGGVQLCTTSNESFGMAVAESLVRGCPVVAPDVGALPELLPGAALFRPGDWTQARQKARKAMEDAAFREELFSTVSKVRDLTSPQRMLEAYRGVVDAVLAAPTGPARVPVTPAKRPSALGAPAEGDSTTLSLVVPAQRVDPASLPTLAQTTATTPAAPRVPIAMPAPLTAPASAVGSTPTVNVHGGQSLRPAQVAPDATPPSGGARVVPRSPFVVTFAQGGALSRRPLWVDAELLPGHTYRLRAITEGDADTQNRAAIVRFEVADGPPSGGKGLSMSPKVGPFLYLTTGPGVQRTDRIFTVTKPIRRYGLTTWDDRGAVALRTLTIEKVESDDRPVDFFLSFDVEALPSRATTDRVDRLVWGRLGGGEYGISRICHVLAQYGFKANFMIDYASCVRDGAATLHKAVDYLVTRGHEVHLHLHTEWLARYWGLESDDPIYLDTTGYDMSRRMLDYTLARHVEFTGQAPRVFRAGGFRFDPGLVLAAGAVGLQALTNVRNDMLRDGIAGDVLDAREPFVWENGVIEIPVDLSPEPLSESFEKFLGRYEHVMPRKVTERTFNLVMHSWSLTHRNEEGVHVGFAPEHEQRLHQMCEHIGAHGRARGYGEYLDEATLPRSVVSLGGVYSAKPEPRLYFEHLDVATCNLCLAQFDRATVEDGVCPACGSRDRQRQLKDVLDTYGNVFDGRAVLVRRPLPAERYRFLRGAARVVVLDEQPGRDSPSDVRHTDAVADGAFDAFLDMDVLDKVEDGPATIAEIARVLGGGGVFVAAVPDQTAAAGWLAELSTRFKHTLVPATDAVTKRSSVVLLAYKL